MGIIDYFTPSNTSSLSNTAFRSRLRLGILIALAVLALGVVAYSARHGWEAHRNAWTFFQPGRFRADIQRNYGFGTMVLRHGWLNFYDDQAQILRDASDIEDMRQRARATQDAMNYSPLRAWIFSRWAASVGEPARSGMQSMPEWKENDKKDPDFNRYLNTLNTSLALAGAVAAGLLVYTWSRRRRDPTLLVDDRTLWQQMWPIIAAVIAFAVFWYNPAGLILAHGWPSPNAWVMPFFLWALVFASWELWFVSGVVIGIGAMAQGQHLLVAPVFLLWPIFAGQPMRAVRWLIGFGIAFMGIVSGWMLTIRPDLANPERYINAPAVWWIACSALVIALLPVFRWVLAGIVRRQAEAAEQAAALPDAPGEVPLSEDQQVAPEVMAYETPDRGTPRKWLWRGALVIGLLSAVVVLTWPLLGMLKTHAPAVLGAMFWSTAVLCLVWFGGWRVARYAVPAIVAVQLLLCMPLYGASDSWWLVGFKYGTERHPDMAVGTANNLGAILRESYGFRSIEEVVTTITPASLLSIDPPAPSDAPPTFLHTPIDITMRTLMLAIYGLMLILASIATAIQWRRRDPNFLLAATVPWVLFALVPLQIHERYLGFAGLAAAVWIGARSGIGWTLLGGFISFVAYAQIANCMAGRGLRYPRPPGTESFFDQFFNMDFIELVRDSTPDASWALLLAMLMVLFAAFTRGRARRAKPVVEEAPIERAEEPQTERGLLVEPLPA